MGTIPPVGSGPQNVYGSSGFPPQIKQRHLLQGWANRIGEITNPKDYNTALNAIDNVNNGIKAWTGQ